MSSVEYFFPWGASELKDLVDLIESDNKPEKLIVFSPEEWEAATLYTDPTSFTLFKRFLDFHNVKLEIITGAVLDSKLSPNYFLNSVPEVTGSWPTFFANFVLRHSFENQVRPFGHNKEITKHFTSLNGRAHPWRCMFIDYMYKENLFQHGFISWHNTEEWSYQYDFKWWTPERMEFDQKWIEAKKFHSFLNIFIPPEEFKDSLFSIISESHPRALFITEKTYVPIYHQRPFLISGAPYTHRYLKKMGFKLFDEVIDYSFDKELDDEKRCEMFMKEVAKLCQYDITELQNKLQKKVLYNFNNLLNIVQTNEHASDSILDAIQGIPDIDQREHYHQTFDIKRIPDNYNFLKKVQK
jgi:hypothetical protein